MNTTKLIMNKRDARPLHDDRYGTAEGAVWETAGPEGVSVSTYARLIEYQQLGY